MKGKGAVPRRPLGGDALEPLSGRAAFGPPDDRRSGTAGIHYPDAGGGAVHPLCRPGGPVVGGPLACPVAANKRAQPVGKRKSSIRKKSTKVPEAMAERFARITALTGDARIKTGLCSISPER